MNPQVFDDAIQVLRERGWSKGKFQRKDGSMCLLGALGQADSGCPGTVPREIREALAAVLPRTRLGRRRVGYLAIAIYNDGFHMDQGEVERALRRAKAHVEAGLPGKTVPARSVPTRREPVVEPEREIEVERMPKGPPPEPTPEPPAKPVKEPEKVPAGV